MEAETFWKAYVGERTPREFLERRQGRSLRDFVDSYISQIPHFYGIVQRGTWRETLAAAPHWRKEEVAVGLLTYLEMHREDWEHLETAPPAAEQGEDATQPLATAQEQTVTPLAVAPMQEEFATRPPEETTMPPPGEPTSAASDAMQSQDTASAPPAV